MQLFTKFTKIILKLHILKYNWNFLDHPFLPYKFHRSDIWGMYFFNFASYEQLSFSVMDVTFFFYHNSFITILGYSRISLSLQKFKSNISISLRLGIIIQKQVSDMWLRIWIWSRDVYIYFQNQSKTHKICLTRCLRGYCTPDQFCGCLCIFLKNYNTLVTSKICFL